MGDFDDLAISLRNKARLVVENSTRVQQAVAREVLKNLIVQTPVDTGHAESNWLVGLGAARTEVVGDVPSGKGSSAAKRALASGAAGRTIDTITAGNAVIAQSKGDDLHISNNVPYINRLNQGWSQQAPAGFIELAIQAGLAKVAKAKILDGEYND